MSKSHLDSLHLESSPRREAFRRVREAIQAACGQATLHGQLQDLLRTLEGEATPTLPPGMVPDRPHPPHCWLMDRHKVHLLKIGINTVGRLPDNDVVIEDPIVSRRHCVIVIHSDVHCELHDIASKNGTLLNGQRLTGPTRIYNGDEIILCERCLTFMIASVPRQTHPFMRPTTNLPV